MKVVTALLSLALAVVLCQGLPSDRGVLLFTSSCDYLGKTHNFSYGSRIFNDRILYEDNLSYKSKFMRIVDVDVSYPRQGVAPAGTISYIEVLDKRADGTGGCVLLRNGGPGQRSVTLNLKSVRNHGMDFIIRIYGK